MRTNTREENCKSHQLNFKGARTRNVKMNLMVHHFAHPINSEPVRV